MRFSSTVLCGTLLCAGVQAQAGDPKPNEALKDCIDKQQASNTTHLTHEQMIKACQDQLRATKAATPAVTGKRTAKRSANGQPLKQDQRK